MGQRPRDTGTTKEAARDSTYAALGDTMTIKAYVQRWATDSDLFELWVADGCEQFSEDEITDITDDADLQAKLRQLKKGETLYVRVIIAG